MRAITDLIESVFHGARLLVLLFWGGIILFGLMATFGASYILPTVAEDYGERAERLGERAIEAQQQAEREHELGKDGWGYSRADSYEGRSYNDEGELEGGWGDES